MRKMIVGIMTVILMLAGYQTGLAQERPVKTGKEAESKAGETVDKLQKDAKAANEYEVSGEVLNKLQETTEMPSGSLSDQEKGAAVQYGLKAKGRFTGLAISDTSRSIMNAFAAMGSSNTTPSGTGFSLAIYTPQTWIAQQASNSAKRYETFRVSDITEDMLSPVLRIIVHPDTPNRITADGMRYTSSVQHVVLRDEAKTFVVQPISESPFSETTSSALRDVSYQGMQANFPVSGLQKLRGPDGDKEFLIVIIGDGLTERTFKIKKKHFDRLPYTAIAQ
jgi:hypothetical protein